MTIPGLPRILIVVRAGRNSLHRSWSYLCHPIADVAVSTYDDTDWSGPDVNYLHHAPGGKFRGIRLFFADNPVLLEAYDYVWAFEDDLLLPYPSLERIRSLLAQFRFPLAAPALSYESFFSWPMAVQNERLLFRGTDFVEIMAPLMSRDFLRVALPHFDENHSGWGYEWLWRKILNDQKSFAAILDAAPIIHTRPIGKGSLYKNVPAGTPSAKEERDALFEKFDLGRGEPFRTLFGVTIEDSRLLLGDQLLCEMLGGYPRLLERNFGNFTRCIDALLTKNRPTATVDRLREMAGFIEVEDALRSPLKNSRAARRAARVPTSFDKLPPDVE